MLWFTMRTVQAVVVEVGQREGFWEEKKERVELDRREGGKGVDSRLAVQLSRGVPASSRSTVSSDRAG